jgi:uncharacterized membrane protein YidH (DUF202 family)
MTDPPVPDGLHGPGHDQVSGDRERNDRGASAERTRLAWRRTGLSATVVALLAARPAFAPRAGAATVLVAAAVMIGWTGLIALGFRRTRGLVARPPRPGQRAITAYALLTAALAAIAGLVVLL